MSTPNPFPLEDQAEDERRPLWNPESASPRWYDGLGFSEDTAYLGPFYRVLEGAGNGVAKGEAMLAGIWHAEDALGARYLGNVPGVGTYFREKEKGDEEMLQDARERVSLTTPDPATTGTAAQMVHSVVSGAYRATLGSMAGGPLGGAAALGGTEAVNRFQELTERGVDTATAAASAGVSGVTGGVGALMPGGFGSTLFTRLLTGAGSNVGMGMLGRYADHKILEAGGYQEMADQQHVWDSTQVAADALLGAAFGGLTHLHATQEAKTLEARQALLRALPAWGESSGATDAARALEVARADRVSAPGVPVDPASAAAHQAALEQAQADLLTGQPVNVSDTGVHDAQFLSRPRVDEEAVAHAFREAGILDEEQNLRDLEAALERRMRGERGPEPVQTPTQPTASGTTFATEVRRPESVTSGSPAPDAPAFVREFEEQNPQNPDEPAQRLVNGNVSVGLVTDPTNPNTAHIESVRALQTGEGAGSKAMERIAELADKHGVRLTLHADPLEVEGIDSRKLVEWYKRFGFRVTHSVGEGALMERTPGGAPEAALLPEPEELESVGAEHSLDNAYAVALTARAAQLEPDRVWQLAERHQADTPRFIRAIQAIVDEHEATHPSGGQGTEATATESGRAAGRQSATGERQPGESGAVAARVAGNDTTGATPRDAGTARSADDNRTADLTSQALNERPDLQIADETGKPVSAAEALQQTDQEVSQGTKDIKTAVEASINCFMRKGG